MHLHLVAKNVPSEMVGGSPNQQLLAAISAIGEEQKLSVKAVFVGTSVLEVTVNGLDGRFLGSLYLPWRNAHGALWTKPDEPAERYKTFIQKTMTAASVLGFEV